MNGTLWTIAIAALSGGLGTWMVRSFASHVGLRQSAQAEFRDDLMATVEALRKRVDKLEEAHQEEQRARVRAELRAEMLARRIEMLVEELNRLREKEGMEPLDPGDYKVAEIPIRDEISKDNRTP